MPGSEGNTVKLLDGFQNLWSYNLWCAAKQISCQMGNLTKSIKRGWALSKCMLFLD